MSIDIDEYLEVHNMTYLHGHLSYFGYGAIPIVCAYFATGECFAPQPMHLQRRDASLNVFLEFFSFLGCFQCKFVRCASASAIAHHAGLGSPRGVLNFIIHMNII